MSPSPHPASSEASSSRQQQQQQPVANSDTIGILSLIGRDICAPSDNKKRVRYICYLCRRRFPGLEQLNKHERLSDLHRSNLEVKVAIIVSTIITVIGGIIIIMPSVLLEAGAEYIIATT